MVIALLHAVALVIAGGCLLGSGVRIAQAAVGSPDLRILAAGSVAATAAIGEALVLGLVRLGADAWVLTGAAVLTYVVACRTTDRPEVTLAEQLRAGTRALSPTALAAGGSVAGLSVAWCAWLLWRPLVGVDGLQYHLGEPALWLHDGRPGSLHHLFIDLPLEAYPKTGEVLLSWSVAISRTPAVSAVVMIGTVALTAVAVWSLCRRLGATGWWASALTLGLVVSPMPMTQLAGANTDLIVLCWIAVTAALCVGVFGAEPRVAPFVLLAAALAVSSKTTALPVALVAIAVTGWHLRRELGDQRRTLLATSVVALPLAALWYVQAWVAYGAPLWPFSSFPAGGTRPRIISALGASFLSDPGGALRVGTAEGYARFMASVLVLGVATLVLLVASLRRGPRAITWLGAGAVVETVAWMAAPFTGWSGFKDLAPLVVYDTRYLLPGAVVFTAVVAAALATGGWWSGFARAAAVAALGLDVWGIAEMAVPERPPTVWIVGGLGYGFAVGAAVVAGRRLTTPAVTRRLLAPTTAVAAVAVLLLAQVDYISRSATGHAQEPTLHDATVLAFLDSRPDWVSGDAPLRSGPYLDALYAGPHLDHPMSVIGRDVGCAELRRDVRMSWLVITDFPADNVLLFGHAYSKLGCLAGIAPVFVDPTAAVWAPTG